MADEALTLGDLDSGNEPAPQVIESVAETMRSVMEEGDASDAGVSDAGTEGQPRDERGRFSADRDAADEDDGEADGTGEPGDADGKEPGDKTGADAPLDPPADWTAEQHEIFRALSPDGQKFVLDRVHDANTKGAEAAQTLERHKAMYDLIGEFRGRWAAKGLDEVQAIRSIGTLSDFADRQPAEFIKWFADGKGIDLAAVAGVDRSAAPATDGDDDDYADPEVKALKGELAATRRELAEMKGHFETRTKQETDRATAMENERVMTAVNAFREEKGTDGKLAHPYFDQVADLMVSLIKAEQERGKNLSLTEAYETACRADRDVSAKIESERKAKAAREEAKKRHEKSTAATRAGSSVSGKPAPTETRTSDEIADILTAEAKRVGFLPNTI